MLTLWGGGTVRCFRAHWMLAELGLEYRAELIGSRTGATQQPAFRRLNPKEKIPVLVDDDLVLTESAAIIAYLGDRYGAGSGLLPAPGSDERVRYDEWQSFVLMELDAHTLYVMRRHRDLAALYGEAPAAVAAAEAGFRKQVQVAAARLEAADFLLGDRFTAADLLLHSCLSWAERYGIDLPPPLGDWCRSVAERPAYGQAWRRLIEMFTAGLERRAGA